jgi:glutaminyl-tRNA synthetase
VITNLPESETIWLTVQNHPKDPDMGQRSVPFTREIFIDRADFQLQANRKYKRLVLQDEVRLRGGYVIKAESVVMGDQDDILEIHGVYDPETLGVNPPDRKIRGVIHWVSASENMPAVFHRFEPLFSVPFPDAVDEDYRDLINPNSRSVFQGFAEVSLKNQPQDTRFQFEREGYFILDEAAEDEGSVCYNEIVGLRDSWSKGG